MKTNGILIAAAALALAGCLRETAEPSVLQDTDAIGFSAYTGAAVTKGVAVGSGEVYGSGSKGIGVFAFYQPTAGGAQVYFNTRKFATPDFMYNQQVSSSDGNTWSYTPIKYWPNNSGDMLSFFAYAPYEEGTTWDDLGIATDATASKITASFPIYSDKNAMQDILWADPQINKTKASTVTGGINNPITFSFRHILSKIAVYVGVEQNTATGTPTAWTDGSTTITIDKVEFIDLADAYKYSCPITSGTMGTGVWKVGSTTQDIVLSRTDGDFNDDNAVIDNQDPWTTAGYYDLLAQEKNTTDAFLFLAPQGFTDDKEKIIITYTVKTTASEKANNSTITNTISTDLYDFLPAGFESGKAYSLNLLIGMNSVNITASVAGWDDPTEHKIDVPANSYIVANSLTLAQEAVTDAAGDLTTLTVNVTQDAADNATAENVTQIGDNYYLQFTLKKTSPKTVNFELPAAPSKVGDTTITGWVVNYEAEYPTDTVTVNAPEGTKVKIEAPTSHVEVTGTSYAEIIASTGSNTLVIPEGTTVDNLTINKGGLEIHGTVTAAQVSVSGTDSVFVRDCEGLSKAVYDVLAPYIDDENCYVGEQESGKETYRIYKRIVAKIGDTKYSSLAEAIDAVVSDGTIQLISDIAFGEFSTDAAITVNNGKSFTIDLNGRTISGTATKSGYSALMIVSNGTTLTLKDSGSGGTITYHSTCPDPSWGYGTYTIDNQGTLNLQSGSIVNTTVNGASYAVENHANHTSTDVIFNMSGGSLQCDKGDQALRLYGNNNTGKCQVNITGGTIVSGGIWTNDQTASSTGACIELNISGTPAIAGNLDFIGSHDHTVITISGGTFTCPKLRLRSSQSFSNTKPYANISGGTWTITTIDNQNTDSVTTNTMSITGGTFNSNMDGFIASGYEAIESGGIWTVKQKSN